MQVALRGLKSRLKLLAGHWFRRWRGPARQVHPGHWNLELGRDAATFAGVNLLEVVKEHGTPIHVCDVSRIDANLSDLDGLGVYYSYKTHPVPALLQRLHSKGAGAEVISEMELDLALRLAVPPQKIIYNGPAKSDRSLRTAIEKGIRLINLNHSEEIERVAAIAREIGHTVDVGLRVNVHGGWSSQFGNAVAEGEAFRAIEQALGKQELRLIALHSHRGELIDDRDSLLAFVQGLLEFVERARRRFGWEPTVLDLGGSVATKSVRYPSGRERRFAQTFGVEVHGPEPATRLGLREYAESLQGAVSKHYRDQGRAVPELVVEPGRAVTGDAQLLLCSVVETRAVRGQFRYAILDAGVNLAAITQMARHQIFALGKAPDAPRHLYRLVGPICHPGDVLCLAIELPELMPGDVLAIMDSGAYFEPDSTVFSFPRPGTLMISDGEARWARRPETLDDVLARDEIEVKDGDYSGHQAVGMGLTG